MGANLVQYGLGLLGLNRVKNPLSLKDGELTVAQNAAVSLVRARAGIRKRPGFGLLLPGSGDPLLALLPIPFDDWNPGDPVVPLYPPYPPFPGPPWTGPVPSSVSDTGMSLTWPPIPWADWYNLFLSLLDDMSSPTAYSVYGGASYDLSGLDPGTPYFFQVQGVNDRGSGPLSDVSSASTTGEPPPPEFPSSGTFYLYPVEQDDQVVGSDTEQTLSVSFGSTIHIVGLGDVSIASLPPGFSIVYAMAWVSWIASNGAGYAPVWYASWNGAESAALHVGGGDHYAGVGWDNALPRTVAALCASTLKARLVTGSGGGKWEVLNSETHTPNPYISGSFEVVP